MKDCFLQAHKDKNWFTGHHFVTLDIADIYPDLLLAHTNNHISHVRVNGCIMPFANNTFPLLISNHAIDFLPREALIEAARVLIPGGYAIFNLHHPNMLTGTSNLKPGNVRTFWDYLLQTNHLFQSADEITNVLQIIGFTQIDVQLSNDYNDTLWNVQAKKITNHHN